MSFQEVKSKLIIWSDANEKRKIVKTTYNKITNGYIDVTKLQLDEAQVVNHSAYFKKKSNLFHKGTSKMRITNKDSASRSGAHWQCT